MERRARPSPAHDWSTLVLDEIDYGVFLLDATPRVLFANRVALSRLQDTSAMTLDGRELKAKNADDTRKLEAALNAAADSRLRRMVMIGQRGDRVALAVVPLPRVGSGHQSACVLVLMSRPKLCEDLSAHGFGRDHGLSSAEDQVLRSLCNGLQANEIAALNGVKVSTVRTQIASIRQKTDTTSIVELVQRVGRLPPIRSALRHEGQGPL